MSAPRAHLLSEATKDYRDRLLATDSSTEPQIELSIPVALPDAAGDIDVVLDSKFEVTEIVLQKRGGATGAFANTVQAKNGADAISDAISINGTADGGLVRSATIDDAFATIAAGGTLRLTTVKAGGTAACLAIVRGFMRA